MLRQRWNSPALPIPLLLMLASCAQRDTELSQVAWHHADSAGVSIVTIEGSVGGLESLRISGEARIEIAPDEAPQVGSYGEVLMLSSGDIWVEDNQTGTIWRFDSEGEVQGIIARRGDGPGEFRNLTQLSVTIGDTVIAFDRRRNSFAVFDGGGALLGTIPVSRYDSIGTAVAVEGWGLDTQHLLLQRVGQGAKNAQGAYPRRQPQHAILSVLDGRGTTIASPVVFDGGYTVEIESGDLLPVPFANEPAIATGSGRAVYGTGATYDLTVSDSRLRTIMRIRWPEWDQPLDPAEVRVARSTVETAMAAFRARAPEMARVLLEARFSSAGLPDMRPAIGRVMIDSEKRLWVSRFLPRIPGIDEGENWHVLDSVGRPIGRLQLPRGHSMIAVGDNRLAVVDRDSLDVERLRVFTVEAVRRPH